MSIKIDQINEVINKQKQFFQSSITLDYNYRKTTLKKLYNCIKKYEEDIVIALKEDLGKSKTESYMCEIGLCLSEITYMIKHLKKYMKIKKVKSPLSQFPSKCYKVASPYGNVLIMSPWNYPFLLTMQPLVDAIAAGNTCIVKPSAYSPSTSNIVDKIIDECFDEEYVCCIKGGRLENNALLDQKFDFIFFTGSQNVGKIVLEKASRYLTPAVLELGGKSPCIIDKTANIKLAAKRIVFGKYLNCGQTCVAPDYVLCDSSIKDEFIEEVKKQILSQFSDNVFENTNYGKIVNEKHFERLCGLIKKEKLVYGGNTNKELLKIEPTVLDDVTWDDSVMQEEIFGPIMPILTFDSFDEVYALLKDKAKPLALYVFSNNKSNINSIINKLNFGGGCINDVIIHLAVHELGFGGVGESGMGMYHGEEGFRTFSHYKSIVNKKQWLDLPMRYQPYNNKKEKTIRKFLK